MMRSMMIQFFAMAAASMIDEKKRLRLLLLRRQILDLVLRHLQ